MQIAAVLCLCAAVGVAALGGWLLAKPSPQDPTRQALRAVAPTQLAAAAMLAAGGTIALSAPRGAALVVIMCVGGAVATVAAGCWQSAKALASREAAAAVEGGCGSICASCTLSCDSTALR
jgi:hypothetical protein